MALLARGVGVSKPKNQPTNLAKVPAPVQYASQIGQGLAEGLGGLGDLALSIGRLIDYPLNKPIPKGQAKPIENVPKPFLRESVQPVAQQLLQRGGYDPVQASPQSFAQDVIRRGSSLGAGEAAIGALTGGVSVIPAALRSAGGALGGAGLETAAKKLGFSKGTQNFLDFVGTLGGSLASGYLGRFGFRTPGKALNKDLHLISKTGYDAAEELGDKIVVGTEKAYSKLDNLWNRIATTEGEDKNKVIKQFHALKRLLSVPKTTAEKAIEFKRNLNDQYRFIKGNYAKGLFDEMRNIIKNNILDAASKKSPEFGKAYTAAEEAHQFLRSEKNIMDLAKEKGNVWDKMANMKLTGKMFLSYLFPSLGKVLVPGTVAGKIIGKAGQQVEHLYNAYQSNPTTQKAVTDLIKAAASDNARGITTALSQLDSATSPEIKKGGGGVRLARLGRK